MNFPENQLRDLPFKVQCPLCGHDQIHPLECISTALLTRNYREVHKVEVGHLFSTPEISFNRCHFCDLHFFHPLVTGDEKFYEVLQRYSWYYISNRAEFDYSKERISPSDNVLEVGCSYGYFADKIKCNSYLGLEFNQKAVETAVQRGHHVIKAPVQQIAKERPGQFSKVVSFEVLEHVDNPRELLQACVDCMAPGGELMISIPSEEAFLIRDPNCLLNSPPHHVSRYTRKTLKEIASMFNLELLEIYEPPMEEFHIDWYYSVLAINFIRKTQNIPFRYFYEDTRAIKDAKAMEAVLPILKKMHFKESLPKDIVILGVYRKPKQGL